MRAIAEMAHGLKMNAEGVETKDQFPARPALRLRRDAGIWISPPLPAEGINELLSREIDIWVRPT